MPIFSSLLLLALLRTGIAGDQCESLNSPPAVFQVAWVSPLKSRVSSSAWLDVVRVADLRGLVQRLDPDPVRLLQALGLTGPRGLKWYQADTWKVTLFDIEADWLCRPVYGANEGEILGGVTACPRALQKGGGGFDGCGYTHDTLSNKKGLDVYRIQWKDASRGGFCVMPLTRFIAGA